MRTHTFTANRLDQALKRVKRELGANAVIVSSRRIDANQFEVRAIASEDATAWEPPPLQATPTRESLLSRLLARAEVSPDLAARLCAQVETQPRSLRDAQEALAAALETTVHFNVPPLDQGQMALAFVGPTGVGKTTTLAKLRSNARRLSRINTITAAHARTTTAIGVSD